MAGTPPDQVDFQGPEQKEKYQSFVSRAKKEARNGNLEESIALFRKALDIRPSEKLTKNIEMMEEALASLALDQDGGDGFVDVCQSGLMLYEEMYEKLYQHQREGVAFLYSLFRDRRKGGILADDMGLGKTIQVVAFLSGMFDAELIHSVLLVMPITLISNWVKEFAKWTPGLRVNVFHGASKASRSRSLERIQRKKGVLVTSYNMVVSNWQQISSVGETPFAWDYVILDEAHKIKTPSAKTTKCLHAIPSRNRVLLTGTPIQNNLKELWSLFDFACQGSLLGTMKTFKMEYEDPITRARAKDATPGEKALGLKIAENLMSLIKPYFLRRSKEELQEKAKSEQQRDLPGDQSKGACLQMPSLPRKNDFIVWVYLAPIQEEIYKKFVSLDHIKELLMTTRSPLAELNVLKKLCDHPRLLSARACSQLGLETSNYNEAEGGENEANRFSSSGAEHISDEILIKESGKLGFLLALLARLQEEGHRTLVFSQSKKMLDVIERILTVRDFRLLRIDGTVNHVMERQRRITMFQKSKDYSVFLLTSQVGGVGITLTAATRVVILDPSWNPAVDSQAVDRVYRIGQKENVIVYRLITCGTVEEKIYRRQVFKDSLIRQSTGDKKNPYRYFTTQELRELFTLEDFRHSATQTQLQSLHASQRKTDAELDEHIAYLHSLEIFGISDHDLMYTRDTVQKDEPEDEEAHNYIKNRVQKAQELVRLESQVKEQEMENMKNLSETAWLREMESFVQPKKKMSKSSPNQAPIPPVPAESSSSNESVSLVNGDDDGGGGGGDTSVINISSKVTSLVIEDQDVPNMDESLQMEEEAKETAEYQCEETHDSRLVSLTSEAHLLSDNESCSPAPKAMSSEPSVGCLQSLEKSEISSPYLHADGAAQENEPDHEETHRYVDDSMMEKPLRPSPNHTLMLPVAPEPKSNNERVILVSYSDESEDDDVVVVNVSSKLTSPVIEDLNEEDQPCMDVSLQREEAAKHEQNPHTNLVPHTSGGHSFSNNESCSPTPKTISSEPSAVPGSTFDDVQLLEKSEISSPGSHTHEAGQENEPDGEETIGYIGDTTQKDLVMMQLEAQLKELEMKDSKNMMEKPLRPSPNHTLASLAAPEPKSNHELVLISDDEERSDDESVVNVSSKMTSLVIEEEIAQGLSPQTEGGTQGRRTHDPRLVSHTSEGGSFSNTESCSPESKTGPQDSSAGAGSVFNDVQRTSLQQSPGDRSFSKPQTEQNLHPRPMSSFSQAYSVSDLQNCSPESKMFPFGPPAETSSLFDGAPEAPLWQSLEYESVDADQETEAKMSCDAFASPPGQTEDSAVMDTRTAFQSQTSKMSNFSDGQESGKSEITPENESPVDSSLFQGHFNLCLEDSEDHLQDSLQRHSLMGDTVNSGLHLNLNNDCSSDAQSWVGETGDNEDSRAGKSLMVPVTVDCSDPVGDASEGNSDVFFGLRKKPVRRIVSDSEEEEEESHLVNGLDEVSHRSLSFLSNPHGVCMSTPKEDKCRVDFSLSPWVKMSGRRSNASRRSLVDVLLDQAEDMAEAMEMASDTSHGGSCQSNPEREESEGFSEQEWEPSGETLDSEG